MFRLTLVLSGISCYLFSETLDLNTKVNNDNIFSSCLRLTFYLFLEKLLLTIVLIFFSNRNMNSRSMSLSAGCYV